MLTEKLPVFRTVYELISIIYDYVSKFPRQYRYTIGEKLTNESLGLFIFISKANRDINKRSVYLNEFLVKFEVIKTLIKLITEKRIICLKQAAHLAKFCVSIEKQITSWKKCS